MLCSIARRGCQQELIFVSSWVQEWHCAVHTALASCRKLLTKRDADPTTGSVLRLPRSRGHIQITSISAAILVLAVASLTRSRCPNLEQVMCEYRARRQRQHTSGRAGAQAPRRHSVWAAPSSAARHSPAGLQQRGTAVEWQGRCSCSTKACTPAHGSGGSSRLRMAPLEQHCDGARP